MTEKEKAKAYDKAIERAKKLYGNGIAEEIFSELKEDETERIKKDLIQWIDDFPDIIWRGHYKKDIIAWLEEQESYYTFEIKEGHWYKCVCDYMLNGSDLMFKNDNLYYCRSNWRLRGEIDERNVKDIGVNGYKSFFRPATNQEIKDWLEKQGEDKKEINNFDVLPGLYKCIHRMFDGTPDGRLLFEIGNVYKCLSKHDRAEFEVSYGHSVYLEDPVVCKYFIPFESKDEQASSQTNERT